MTHTHKTNLRMAIAYLRELAPGDFDLSTERRDFTALTPDIFPDQIGRSDEVNLHFKSAPQHSVYYEQVAARLFGIIPHVAFSLFGLGGQKDIHPSLPVSHKGTTPNEFAALLERFLALDEAGEILSVYKSYALEG